MIRFVDDSLTQTVYEFKNDSAFTVRIKALLKAYSGTQMGEIWVQNPEDRFDFKECVGCNAVYE